MNFFVNRVSGELIFILDILSFAKEVETLW